MTVNVMDFFTAMCIERGVPHREGEVWEDGCDTMLTCEDGNSNTISRRDRCVLYIFAIWNKDDNVIFFV